MRELCVYVDATLVGTLQEDNNIWSFTYAANWLAADEGFDLSPALFRKAATHLDGSSVRPVQWYFDNLLPEEGLRLARRRAGAGREGVSNRVHAARIVEVLVLYKKSITSQSYPRSNSCSANAGCLGLKGEQVPNGRDRHDQVKPLREQRRHLPHGQEQTQRGSLERLEAEMPIKALRALVLRIHDHRHGCDLLRRFQAAAKGIHEQEFTDTLTAD